MKLIEAVKQTPPKVLFYGPAGTWKTTAATTWGSVSQIIDLDKGLLSALKVKDKWTDERARIDVLPCYDTNPLAPSAFEKAKTEIYRISEECTRRVYPFKVLIIDSLSSLGDHAMRMILRNSGKITAVTTGKPYQVTQQEWGLAITEVENLLSLIRSLPICVIVIAHELTESIGETDAKRIKIWALGAKLPDKIPTYFDEIWHSRVRVVGAERIMSIQTYNTTSIVAKSRGCLPDDYKLSVEGLQAALKICDYDPK